MPEWWHAGRFFDLVLAVTFLEWGGFALWRRFRGGGLSALEAAFALAPGAFLVIAARLAYDQSWWGWVGAALLAAFIAHLGDLTHRLRRTKSKASPH